MTQSNTAQAKGQLGKRKRKSKNQDWAKDLLITHANAAGIDVGNEEHYV